MPKPKQFDCIEMKRRIQEQLFDETKEMSHLDFAEHIRQRIEGSRFSSFLKRPASGGSAAQ
ncbi:MAG: hypothetical protein HYV27_02715 [Candidatus Hydrogenedentes bacterium]|nr:hypothetical protein [Candidatus Hydrogenedentota bacterium]